MCALQQQFTQKVVWITGASSGYGKAMAQAFSKSGAKLVLSARREDELNALAQTLPEAAVLPLDLSQADTFVEKTKDAIAAFGQIDLIVHNGAIAQRASVLKTTMAVERHIMDVDYFSYTELTRCLLPHMLERKTGHIAVVSGLLAHINLPERSTYAAAKAALIAYFGCLRAELLGKNIDVTVLIPGAMQTDLASKSVLADGSLNTQSIPQSGCTVTEAASQTLEVIAQKRVQAYIGLKDEFYQLWRLTLSDPEQGVQLLLNKIKMPH